MHDGVGRPERLRGQLTNPAQWSSRWGPLQIPFAASAHQYDKLTILLHWATTFLVVLLWGMAQVIDLFPNGQPRITVRSLHILLGVTLGVLLLLRISWRINRGRGLPPANDGIMGMAAILFHFGLYALVAATVLLGLANVWVRGDNVFGLFTIPAFDPADRVLRGAVGNLHGTAADAILVMAGLHAVAALFHHYVLRDGVLRRMLPVRQAAR